MSVRTPEIFGLPWWLPVGGVAALIFWPSLTGRFARGAAGAAVRVIHDAATGAVIATGELVGIPATDAAKCEADVEAGDWWGASFACPAGTFLKTAGGAVIDVTTGALVGIATYSPIAEIIRLAPIAPDMGPLPGIAPPPASDTGEPGQVSDWPAA